MKAIAITIITLISLITLASPLTFADTCSNSRPGNGSSSSTLVVPCYPATKVKAKIRKFPRPALITVTIYPGSLKYNITRIANNHGWDTVVWKYPADFNWVGQTQITADTLQNVFIKLLSNYPLQAQFYNGNRVIVIVPRNLS